MPSSNDGRHPGHYTLNHLFQFQVRVPRGALFQTVLLGTPRKCPEIKFVESFSLRDTNDLDEQPGHTKGMALVTGCTR